MSPRYDIFLSHSTADKPAVEELARKLVEAGFAPSASPARLGRDLEV